MKVYILGAGASHSYALSPTGVNPPLMNNFFNAFFKLPIASDPNVLIGNLINYIRDIKHVPYASLHNWNENIEDFLIELSEKLDNSGVFSSLPIEEQVHLARVYDEMLFLLTSILNEVQNGPVCNNYSRLLTNLNKHDVLITFNWDTLLDRSLWETGEWYPSDGYEIAFNNLFVNDWQVYNHTDSRNKLLKLHGSTNWLIPYYSALTPYTYQGKIPDNYPLLYCFIKADKTYKTFKNRSKEGYAPFSYYYYPPNIPNENVLLENDSVISISTETLMTNDPKVQPGYHKDTTYASMPLIILPVKQKRFQVFKNIFDSLWGKALTALIMADEIIVIGYSFPATDINTWNLFNKACQERKVPLRIKIVNPDADNICLKIREKLTVNYSVESCPITFLNFINTSLK